jgi:transposase
MVKPHPVELRARVVGFVDEGHSHRKAARHFRVSPKFVNDMIKLRRETGALAAKRQGWCQANANQSPKRPTISLSCRQLTPFGQRS